MPSPALLALLGGATGAVGVLGGLGGAVLLVPVLSLGGVPVAEAAPLGLLAVAAGSLAASPDHIESGLVNHRLGITVELSASAGALLGASLIGIASERQLSWVLGSVAIIAGFAAVTGDTSEERWTAPAFAAETSGEWPGTLGGLFHTSLGPYPYQVGRLPLGSAVMALAGVMAGLSGTSGGYLKTPTMHRLMGAPLLVASATTTFTVGITAAAGIGIHVVHGRIDPLAGAAIIAGALLGGRLGIHLQSRLRIPTLRHVIAVALVAIGLVLFLRP